MRGLPPCPTGIAGIPEAQAVSIQTALIKRRSGIDVLLDHTCDDFLFLHAPQFLLQYLPFQSCCCLDLGTLALQRFGTGLRGSTLPFCQQLAVIGRAFLPAAGMALLISRHHPICSLGLSN